MQTIFMSHESGTLTQVDEIREDCWVSLIDPTQEELAAVATECGVDVVDLSAALDVEEHSRVSRENGCVLILVDAPTTEVEEHGSHHITIPIGILIAEKVIITVSLRKVPVLAEMESGVVRDINTSMKTRFTLQLLMRTARSYLMALKDIEKTIHKQEANLRVSTRNEALMHMLTLEKSLVYISTSLVSNQQVLERLMRTSTVPKYPEDDDLLEDTMIENEQAMEMASIYSGILSGTMDAYASVIANNQNAIMKTLALITIVLSIPTMIFSAYGMNVDLNGMPMALSVYGFIAVIGIAFVIALIVMFIFVRKKWF